VKNTILLIALCSLLVGCSSEEGNFLLDGNFQNGKVNPVLDTFLQLTVRGENNNDLVQVVGRIIVDYFTSPEYNVDGNTVSISFENSDDIHAIGQIVGNTIRFNIEPITTNQILNLDGSITECLSSYELVYEKIE